MTLLALALLSYVVATAACLGAFASERERLLAFGTPILAVGAALHAAALVLRSIELGHVALTPLGEGLSFLAFAVAVVYLALQWRVGLGILGAFVAPVVAFLTLGALLARSGGAELPPALRSSWLPVHVSLAFLGHAVLALATAASVLYLVEDRRLKEKRPLRGRSSIPSLEKLDRVNHLLLVWGFPLLTLGIVTGAIWAAAEWGSFWSWETREVSSLATWVLYAALVNGRISAGWRGRRAATLTVIGFAVVVGSFVGVNFLFPGRHGGSFAS